jgi:tight adherence protein C
VTLAVPSVLASVAAATAVIAVGIAATDRPTLTGVRGARPAFPRIRLGTPIAFGAAALCLFAPFPAPFLAPLVGIVAWRAPSFAAGRADRRRRARADAELPQLLDLLAAASSAGLSAPQALLRSAGALEGPLADELHSVVQAVDLGGRWRDELRSTADRLALPDLRRTVAALTRTETLGSSLSASMQDLAERVRASRRAAVTERARTAPVKMLFPLVFLVLPAFLLLTVVPVLLSTLQSIR